MEPEPEERTKKSRFKNRYFLELQRNGEDIVDKYRDIVKQYTTFDLDFDILVQEERKSYYCKFYITRGDFSEEVAYCNCNYYLIKEMREAGELFVGSIIPGRRLGEIVFNLQLLLCIISGVRDITLVNNTDDIERATKGIYKLFDIEKRTYDRKNFAGKSKAEQIHLSEGEMRYVLKSDSEDLWNKNWDEIISKLKTASLKIKSKSKKHKKKKHTKRKKKKKQRRKSKMR